MTSEYKKGYRFSADDKNLMYVKQLMFSGKTVICEGINKEFRDKH